MALKPTIFKFRIALTDMNRDHYDSINLTVAQHPSETTQRMMARICSFCLSAQSDLTLTKGLSTIEEPDIWVKSLDNQILQWIDIGEPDPDRIKKASRIAKSVTIYSFNTKSNVWWEQNKAKLQQHKPQVIRLNNEGIEAMAGLVERTMEMSVMISGNSLYINSNNGDVEGRMARVSMTSELV